MKKSWEIALDMQGERGDRHVRLRAIRDQLQSRLDKVQEAIDELDNLATVCRRVQKKTFALEDLEYTRDEFRQMADDPQDLISPPHYYGQVADLCEALLAERGAACN